MRLAFLYGPFSTGSRHFDFDNLYASPRGLTGSELSCVEYAQAMVARGHDVRLLVGQPNFQEREWRGLRLGPLSNPSVVADCDAVFSWNEPNLLMDVSPRPLRMVNQQLNDFTYCNAGWERHVDVVTSPSAHHMAYLQTQAPAVRSWAVLPNGCDPSMYRSVERIPGRVIWASSADRGLHILLEVWPAIKAMVPNASLRAYYNFQKADFDEYEQPGPRVGTDLLEIAQRKRYIEHAMRRLSDARWDVQHIGSVSRDRMREEFERAMVLGYPCDTIRYTEGFSVTTMEACASGCMPVITDIDSLGHIYGAAAPHVKLSGGRFGDEQRAEFIQLVVRGLTDDAWRAEQVTKCRALAQEHAWSVLAARLESLIESSIAARARSTA